MPPVEPKALPTHLPVFPGCQSLSRHLSDGVKRPVPLCHRHSPAGNPCAIVALLALGSSSQKRGLRVAGDSNPCAYLQTTANLSHFVVHFLSPPRTGYSIGTPPFCIDFFNSCRSSFGGGSLPREEINGGSSARKLTPTSIRCRCLISYSICDSVPFFSTGSHTESGARSHHIAVRHQ